MKRRTPVRPMSHNGRAPRLAQAARNEVAQRVLSTEIAHPDQAAHRPTLPVGTKSCSRLRVRQLRRRFQEADQGHVVSGGALQALAASVRTDRRGFSTVRPCAGPWGRRGTLSEARKNARRAAATEALAQRGARQRCTFGCDCFDPAAAVVRRRRRRKAISSLESECVLSANLL